MRDKNKRIPHIGVIGAGSWGTTLAQLLADKGFMVSLWVYEAELCRIMQEKKTNIFYLPGVQLHMNIFPTHSMKEACSDKDFLLIVCPSQKVRRILKSSLPYISPKTIIITASKGLEIGSLLPLSRVVEEVLPSRYHKRLAFLGGPSFAREVISKHPTAVSLASKDKAIAREVQSLLSTPYFRVYTSSDVIGVTLGGALKNIIAIAAGISDGLEFGYNSRAALITRGLAEMTRLGVRMGANAMTFSGLSGLGDLVLTCTSDMSRNHSLGMQLGKGKKLQDILKGNRAVIEGVATTKSAYKLSQKLGIEMPITHETYLMLYRNKSPEKAVNALMSRDLRYELDSPC
jgi:glycerol-3-phosphate dehydrogenase (NAD(P)+)